MGECLREIADEPLRHRVVFFTEKAHVVAQVHEALEKSLGVLPTALQYVDVSKPKAAGEEYPFPGRQAVNRSTCLVAHDEIICQQAPLDRAYGAAYARIGDRQESHAWDQEQARVDLFRSIGLNEAAELCVETALDYLGADPRSQFSP